MLIIPFRTRVLGGISLYTDNCFPKQLFSPELYIARTMNFGKMNIGKFNSLYDLLEAFPTEESCIKYLEQQRWANGIPVSPYDPTSKVYNRGDGMYRCKNMGKNFNVRIGTMFEGAKLPLRKWFVAIYEITSRKKGISSIELSKRISVTYKTAWFMNQHIRE